MPSCSPRCLWKKGPPVLRALAAQGAAFLLILGLAALLAPRLPSWTWPLLQGFLAAVLAGLCGLGPWWMLFQVGLPLALAWQLGHPSPAWIYPVALAGLLLVFGGGLATRVPLYNSSRAAWRRLLELMPPGGGHQVADLGAGLGGPLAFLADQRPDLRFTGVEASPLTWLAAWARIRPVRSNCRILFGSLWKLPLGEFQVVYAFLSPAPMPRLWAKACAEMRPGTLLVSHTFEIPGVAWEARLPLPGRPGAALLLYRIPSRDENQVAGPPAEG